MTKTANRSQPQCESCSYLEAHDNSEGNCHRYPPIFVGERPGKELSNWKFPHVSIHHWCGEHLPINADSMKRNIIAGMLDAAIKV